MKQDGRSQPRTPYTTEYRNKRGLTQQLRDKETRLRRVELRDVGDVSDAPPFDGLTIQHNGAEVGSQPILNFIDGANITLLVSDTGEVIEITITGAAGGSGYDTIQDEGAPLAQESVIDFVGAGVTATAGVGKTIVTISGGTADGAGIYHADYVVYGGYLGSDGDVLTTGTDATVIVYKTIQAAITAADAANASKTIFIVGGTYNENVTIAATFGSGHDLEIIGESKDVVNWGNAASGTALTIASGNPSYRFKGIRFRGAAGTNSVVGSATNISAVFEDCEFARGVSADWAGAEFLNCDFDGGYQVTAGHTPSTVRFFNCEFTGTNTWSDDMQSHQFIGCRWGGVSDIIVVATSGASVFARFVGCHIGGTKTFFNLSNNGFADLEFIGCEMGQPSTNGIIWIQSTAGSTPDVMLTGCRLGASGTNPYIKADRASHVRVASCHIEDNGSVDFTGIFTDSVFGPNDPPDTNIQLDAGSATCMYIGTGAVTGTDALDALEPLPQRGAGVPVHTAPEGTRYWDTTNNNLYVNNNGSTGWTLVGGGGSITAAYQTIQDEGTDLFQRAKLDFIGSFGQARDDIVAAITRKYGDYAHYDSIVDSAAVPTLESNTVSSATATSITVAGTPWVADKFNRVRVLMTSGTRRGESSVITATTTNTITFSALSGAPAGGDTFIIIPNTNVYPTIFAAIKAGAASILYRQSSGEVDFSIEATDNLAYILGDKAGETLINGEITVNVTVNKIGVVMQNLSFTGATALVTLNQPGDVVIGCVFGGGAGGRLILGGQNCSAIACVWTNRTGANDSISVTGQGCRIQACQFIANGISGNHIDILAGTRCAITGCLFYGTSETGYMIDAHLTSIHTVNGNLFFLPTGCPGAITSMSQSSVSGNLIEASSPQVATPVVALAAMSRCAVSGNFFATANAANGSSLKWVQSGGSAGLLCTNNFFFNTGPVGTTTVYICCETTVAGTVFAGNICVLSTSSTGVGIGLNVLTTAAGLPYTFKDNTFLAANSMSIQRWRPIANTTPGSAISFRSIIKDVPSLPPEITPYVGKFHEDFIQHNAMGVAVPFVAAAALGWVSVSTGVGAALINPAGSRNGLVTLITGAGAGAGNDTALHFGSDHIVILNQDASWQVNLPRISSIADVRIRVGFAPIAVWLAMAAGGALPVLAWDYFLLEYDSAILANWQMRFKVAAAAEPAGIPFNTGVAAVAGSTQLIMGVDQNPVVAPTGSRPYAVVNGQFINPNLGSTGITGALVTPGIFIEALVAGADKQVDVDSFTWGDARV